VTSIWGAGTDIAKPRAGALVSVIPTTVIPAKAGIQGC
jgi:hypothetical protein